MRLSWAQEMGEIFGDAIQLYFQPHNSGAILAAAEDRIKVVTGND